MLAATIHGKFEALHEAAVFDSFGPGPLASEFSNGLWDWGRECRHDDLGVTTPPAPARWPVQVSDAADVAGDTGWSGPLYDVHEGVAWIHPDLVTGDLPGGRLNPFNVARLAAVGVWLGSCAAQDRAYADNVPIGQARKYRARAQVADDLAARVQASLDLAGEAWADALPEPAPRTTTRRATTWH